MNHHPLSRRTLFYGGLAALHSLFTIVFPFFSVPIVVWFVRRNLYARTIFLISIPFAILLAVYAWKRWQVIKKSRRLILLLIISIIIYIAIYESVPDVGEKLHVLNFSLLAIFYYKALSPVIKIPAAMMIAWTATSAIGGLDEYLQNYIPGRVGSMHDFYITLRSATIGIILAWIFDSYSRKGR